METKSFLDKVCSYKEVDIKAFPHGDNLQVSLRVYGEYFLMVSPDEAEEIEKALIEASKFAKESEKNKQV